MTNVFPGRSGFEPGVESSATRRALLDLSKRITSLESTVTSLGNTQAGITPVTTDTNGEFTITFPTQYAAGVLPVISAQLADSLTQGHYITLSSSTLSTTSFSGKVWQSHGADAGVMSIDIHWIAVGTLA
jgi:hypothetical protein